MADVLGRNFKSMDALMNAKYVQLININDVGETLCESILSYFKNENNLKLIQDLKDVGLNMDYLKETTITKETPFMNKVVVITGTLENYTRNQMKDELTLLGAKVTNSISKKTDYLICGRDAGSKLEKANKLGVQVLSEEEFEGMVK